ncbi:MAG: hypothetical protein R2695_09630 [Acidimicrobiales bacterium]
MPSSARTAQGKTTTLRTISGLLPVIAGSIDVLGFPTDSRRPISWPVAVWPRRRGSVAVPQADREGELAARAGPAAGEIGEGRYTRA